MRGRGERGVGGPSWEWVPPGKGDLLGPEDGTAGWLGRRFAASCTRTSSK